MTLPLLGLMNTAMYVPAAAALSKEMENTVPAAPCRPGAFAESHGHETRTAMPQRHRRCEALSSRNALCRFSLSGG